MIREIKGYSWGNCDLPIKRDDHAMDELRYYAMYRKSMGETPKKAESALERNFRKLIAQAKRR